MILMEEVNNIIFLMKILNIKSNRKTIEKILNNEKIKIKNVKTLKNLCIQLINQKKQLIKKLRF